MPHLSKNILDFYAKSDYLIEALLTDNAPQEFIKIYSQISNFEKSFKYLFPTSETLFRAKYEYKLYWKKLLKFYYKKK